MTYLYSVEVQEQSVSYAKGMWAMMRLGIDNVTRCVALPVFDRIRDQVGQQLEQELSQYFKGDSHGTHF